MTSVGGPARRMALAIALASVGTVAACGDNAPGNDPPTGANVTLTTAEDTPVSVAIAATDPDDDALTYAVTTAPAHGTLSGTLPGGTYTPAANYHGTDQLTVTVSDGAASVVIRVDVTITPVNDAPAGADDALADDEDTILTIAASTLLANDTDVDDDTLTITAVGDAAGGTVALVGANITFTPTPDFLGTASFTYTLSDGALTDTATVTITVGGINDAPEAADDLVTTDEDTPLVIPAATLLANDTDTEGQALTITAVADAVNGAVALVGTDITFTPNENFHGDASFVYTVTDGAEEDTAVVTVTVGTVNDPPVAVDDAITIAEDESLLLTTSTLLDNDTDLDVDVLTVTAVSDPVNGTVALDGTDITFTPTLDFNGTASFVYTVSDGIVTDTATVVLTVQPGNDLPVATDDSATTDEDVPLVIEGSVLVQNDTDVDGDTLTVFDVRDPVNGTVDLEEQTVTFTPTPNFNGTASFVYTVYDGDQFDTATVTVTVGGTNDAPVAADDAATTDEDTLLVIRTADLLGNDTDADGDTLTVTAVGDAVGGTVDLAGTDITFTPTANFAGAATFTYTVSDGTASDTGLVTVTVVAVNDEPVAVDDAVTTPEETPLVIPTGDLLDNDTDVEGAILVVTSVSDPVGGTAVLDGTSITFTPAPNFTGDGGFVYTIFDGEATDTGQVTVTVTAVNDAPVAVDDAATTAEDTALVIAAADLAGNDTDLDGDALTVTAVGDAVNGSVGLAGGNVTFTPAANFNGAASFTYTVSDGTATDTGLVAVTVTAVNDAPVAVDDVATIAEDTPLVGPLSSLFVNDTDADVGATLSVTAVGGAINGAVVIVGGGFTFTPAANFNGTASFTYTVSDGTATDTGLVTITVTSVNDAPVAVDDAGTTTEDTPLVIAAATLVANDTDADTGAVLTVTAVGGATNGSVGLAGGNVTFTPTANFNGAASFTYTVSDGTATDTGLVAVTVTAVNDGPVAVDDAVTTAEDTPAVTPAATLVANDTDADAGAALTVTAVGGATNGAVGLAGGNVTFTPTANFNGVASYTYTVSDGTLTDTGLVTVTVTSVNDVPVAVDDARTTNEGTALVIAASSLTANDTDADTGATLTVTAVGGATNGSVGLAGGNVTFTPTANFNGAASFTYTVSDGTATDTGLVTVTVTSVNDAPVAVDDARTTNEDTALVIAASSLAANDTDADTGATLTVTAVGGATNGAVGLAGGNVTFTPTANFSGAASFTYTVSDGTATDTGLVTVTVTAVNDAPVAVDDARSTDEDTPLVMTVASLVANDTDIENAALTITAVGAASNGSVGLAAGTVTFTPTAGYSGPGQFTYTLSDGSLTDTGQVDITVVAVNDPPIAIDDGVVATEDTPLVFAADDLVGNDTDVDGDTLTVTAVSNPTGGTVGLAAGNITFTPTPDYSGPGQFTYTVSDGTDTDTGTVSVAINAVNDPPVAVDDSGTTAEDTPLVIAAAALVANDTDVENDTLTVTAVTSGTGGTVALVAGNVTFTPTANFNGAASFTYTVDDGDDTDEGTVDVTVTAVNDAPVAVTDDVTADAAVPLVIPVADLLDNDIDVENATLTVTLVSNPSVEGGSVVLGGGNVTYTAPSTTFSGPDSFTYTISDGALTAVGTVNVTVFGLSFEDDYDRWVLTDSGAPSAGVFVIATSPTTFDPMALYLDHESGETYNFYSSYGPISATDGDQFGFLFQQSGATHTMTTAVTIPASATTLEWDMQYENFAGAFDPDSQSIRVELVDDDMEVVLDELYLTTEGVDPQDIPMTAFSASVAAFAGQTVRLRVRWEVYFSPLITAFDNFRFE
jgi:hypothetical protein